MYLQKESLKIVEDDGDYRYVVDLKSPVKFIEPIFLSGDYWDIQFCYTSSIYSSSYKLKHDWSME